MRAVSIIGGRPNLIKAEPIHHSLAKSKIIQHGIIDIGVIKKAYGEKTYEELGLPKPLFVLQQSPFENYLDNIKFLSKEINLALDVIKPDVLLIYGDIDPSLAASIASMNKNIPSVHIEAGLRNYELNDTEEINRLIIDKCSKYLFCTSNLAKANLINEGFNPENVFVVGNTIITTLKRHLALANTGFLSELGLENKKYGLLTIHREENLTSPERLENIFKGIESVQREIPLIFINYSSTIKALNKLGYNNFASLNNIKGINTLSYHDYIGVLKNSKFVITDSSGIQDETTYLGIPCITCRETTHRVDTLNHGNNVLVSDDPKNILLEAKKALAGNGLKISYPSEWDLDAGKSITTVLLDHMEVFHGRTAQ